MSSARCADAGGDITRPSSSPAPASVIGRNIEKLFISLLSPWVDRHPGADPAPF
jgi:hypothetical protein